MSDTYQPYLSEAQVLLLSLQEINEVFIEKMDNVSDLLKKIVELNYQSTENDIINKLRHTFLELSYRNDSKKHNLYMLFNIASGNQETDVQQQVVTNDREKHKDDLGNLVTDTEGNDFSLINHGQEDTKGHELNPSPIEDPFLSKESTVDINDEIRAMLSSYSEIQKVMRKSVHTKKSKDFDKDLSGRTDDFSANLNMTKLGNLLEEDKRKIIQEYDFLNSKLKTDKCSIQKLLQTFNPVSVNFRLKIGLHSDKTDIYKTHTAVFRNMSPTDLLTDNITPNWYESCNENNVTAHNPNNFTNVVMMPCDIKGNHDELEELRHLLSMSTNNSFSVQIPHGFTLENKGETQLVVDVKIHLPSRKPIKRRYTFRMHVVTSDMFEMASMTCQIQSLELTYTNIFPSDCRMFIALPIYRGGYLDRKDTIDRE